MTIFCWQSWREAQQWLFSMKIATSKPKQSPKFYMQNADFNSSYVEAMSDVQRQAGNGSPAKAQAANGESRPSFLTEREFLKNSISWYRIMMVRWLDNRHDLLSWHREMTWRLFNTEYETMMLQVLPFVLDDSLQTVSRLQNLLRCHSSYFQVLRQGAHTFLYWFLRCFLFGFLRNWLILLYI